MTGENPGWDRPGLADREGPLTEWQAATQHYRNTLHWRAFTFGQAVWILASSPIEALDTPEQLGRRALNTLRDNGITPPVFTAPEPSDNRWVFLVERHDPSWLQRRTRLTALGVEHLWAGVALDLPPTQLAHDHLEWINPPVQPIPEFTAIADAIIHAADAEL